MDGIMEAIIEIITLNNEKSHNYRKNLIKNSIIRTLIHVIKSKSVEII
jgi:hypothetical protein